MAKNTPEPLRSLQKFLREARKAEKNDPRTAGEILFGSMTVHGVKTIHRLAYETDRFVDSVAKSVIGDTR